MMFSQPVEICRQLVESRTVIVDTRRNIVVNSSELGFNIVSCRVMSLIRKSQCYKGSIKEASSFPRFQFLFRNQLRAPNDCRVWRTSMHPRKKVQECVEKCTVMAVKSYLFRS